MTIFDLLPPDTLDLASLLVLPGSAKAKEMTVISGRRYADCLKPSSPVGLLAKMLLGTSHWGSTMCYLTWETSGTPRNRLLYRLVPSAPPKEETGCSLWPTPTASEITARENIELTDTGRRKCKNGSSHSLDLATTVKMWPTPTASQDYKPVRALAPSEANGTHGTMLVGAMGSANPDLIGGQLNPEWVETLMGFPRGWTEITGQQLGEKNQKNGNRQELRLELKTGTGD